MSSRLYEPLRKDQLRLLAIQPGKPMDKVVCKLFIFTLPLKIETHLSLYRPNVPLFEAISYAWGNETERRSIHLSGRDDPVYVTTNCESALRTLRLSDRKRVVWIDGLCINQEDLAERYAQVQIMPKIYSSASQVIIFLGDEANDSDIAMDYFNSFCTRPIDDRTQRAVQTLLLRTWFKRVWVIQEVAVARRATVICGDQSAPWACLLAVANRFPEQPPVIAPIRRLRANDRLDGMRARISVQGS